MARLLWCRRGCSKDMLLSALLCPGNEMPSFAKMVQFAAQLMECIFQQYRFGWISICHGLGKHFQGSETKGPQRCWPLSFLIIRPHNHFFLCGHISIYNMYRVLSHWYWCVDLEWQILTQYITIGDVLPLILQCKGNGGEIVYKNNDGSVIMPPDWVFQCSGRFWKMLNFFLKAPFGQQNECEASWTHWRSHGISALSWWMKIVTTPRFFDFYPKKIKKVLVASVRESSQDELT